MRAHLEDSERKMEGTSTQMMDASYRTCDACGRVFPTVAGLDIHRRDSHGRRRGGAGCGGLVELPPRSSCKETAASDIAVRQAAAGERQDAMLELLTKMRLGALLLLSSLLPACVPVLWAPARVARKTSKAPSLAVSASYMRLTQGGPSYQANTGRRGPRARVSAQYRLIRANI